MGNDASSAFAGEATQMRVRIISIISTPSSTTLPYRCAAVCQNPDSPMKPLPHQDFTFKMALCAQPQKSKPCKGKKGGKGKKVEPPPPPKEELQKVEVSERDNAHAQRRKPPSFFLPPPRDVLSLAGTTHVCHRIVGFSLVPQISAMSLAADSSTHAQTCTHARVSMW